MVAEDDVLFFLQLIVEVEGNKNEEVSLGEQMVYQGNNPLKSIDESNKQKPLRKTQTNARKIQKVYTKDALKHPVELIFLGLCYCNCALKHRIRLNKEEENKTRMLQLVKIAIWLMNIIVYLTY